MLDRRQAVIAPGGGRTRHPHAQWFAEAGLGLFSQRGLRPDPVDVVAVED